MTTMTTTVAGGGPTGRLGRWTGVLGLACAVHCLLTPALIVALPAAAFLGDERVELALLAGSAALAVVNLSATYRTHRRPAAWWLLAAAVALLAGGRLAGDEAAERPLTVAGAALLAASQFVNHWHCRCCRRRRAGT